MVVRLYLDVFQGMNPANCFACASPPIKCANTIRYAIDVDIPDINYPDRVITAVAKEVESETRADVPKCS